MDGQLGNLQEEEIMALSINTNVSALNATQAGALTATQVAALTPATAAAGRQALPSASYSLRNPSNMRMWPCSSRRIAMTMSSVTGSTSPAKSMISL